jgi:hypothetical protein
MPPSPSPSQTQSQTAVILERIETVRCDISELKVSVMELTKVYQDFVVQYTRAHTELASTTERNRYDLANHEKRLEALEALIKPLALQGKILAFIGSALGVLVIGFLWALLTQQFVVAVP